MGTGKFMDYHRVQLEGVEILLVASCCRNRDKLRPDGPLGSYADFTFTSYLMASFDWLEFRKA